MKIIMLSFTFLMMFICCCFIYKRELKQQFSKPIKYYIEIVLIAFILTVLLSILCKNNTKNIIYYFILLILLPYIKVAWQNNKHDEQIFSDVIHYCLYMSSELRQSPNVSYAIEKCCDDMKSEFASDLINVISYFDKDKNTAKVKLDELANKYDFSIIRQLNIIILQLQYDDRKNAEAILDVFQKDIDALKSDVKANQVKRKTLRYQYVGLTIGSLIALIFLINQLIKSLSTLDYEFINEIVYVYIVFITFCLFGVEIYFSNNITKE